MTYNKQIKDLNALIEKLGKDFVVRNYLDTWAFEHTGDMGIERKNVIRESITLGDIYEQFVNKSGIFYDAYKITAQFRDFVQSMSKPYFEPKNSYVYYKDSHDKFIEEWNKLHPEISYEEYEKKERQKDSLRWARTMDLFKPYYDAYDNLFNESYFRLKNILA